LKDALAPVKSQNFASVTDPARVGELMRAIDGYSGHAVTALPLKLAPSVFVRPGELRAAEWSEFDLPNAEWRIPGARMIMSLSPLRGEGAISFPRFGPAIVRCRTNTINAALRRLGYSKEEQTGHGFRSMASTLLNEQGFPRM
jgi:integrase